MDRWIDLNCDLGENPNTHLDEQIMPFISSCSVACGGHAGDRKSIEEVVKHAVDNAVKVGAHPSFADPQNFGRKILNMKPDELSDSLHEQLELMLSVLKGFDLELHHIKPHGALYNLAAQDEEVSELICEVVKQTGNETMLYGLAGSVIEKTAQQQSVKFIPEAFADRSYNQDGTLRSRLEDQAVITEEPEVLQQVFEIALHHRLKADTWIPINAQTLCLHSDTPGAVYLAEKIHQHLVEQGVHIGFYP